MNRKDGCFVFRRLFAAVLSVFLLITAMPLGGFAEAAENICNLSRANGTDSALAVMYVPECIYLTPKETEAFELVDGEYYLNCTDGNGNFTHCGADDRGSFYFLCKRAIHVSISVAFDCENGAVSGLTTETDGGLINDKEVVVSACNQSGLMTWKAEYLCDDGVTRSAVAYTYIYKPNRLPVGAASEARSVRHSKKYDYHGFVSVLWGASSCDGFSDSDGITAERASEMILLGNNGMTAADSLNPRDAKYFDGESEPSIAYCENGSSEITVASPIAHFCLDSSRFNRLSMLPNVRFGLAVTDAYHADGFRHAVELQSTDGTESFEILPMTNYTDGEQVIFNEKDNISPDVDISEIPSGGVKGYRIHTYGQSFCGNVTTETDQYICFDVCNNDKSVLRDAYYSCVNSSYEISQSEYTEASLQTYFAALKKAGELLGNPVAGYNEIADARDELEDARDGLQIKTAPVDYSEKKYADEYFYPTGTLFVKNLALFVAKNSETAKAAAEKTVCFHESHAVFDGGTSFADKKCGTGFVSLGIPIESDGEKIYAAYTLTDNPADANVLTGLCFVPEENSVENAGATKADSLVAWHKCNSGEDTMYSPKLSEYGAVKITDRDGKEGYLYAAFDRSVGSAVSSVTCMPASSDSELTAAGGFRSVKSFNDGKKLGVGFGGTDDICVYYRTVCSPISSERLRRVASEASGFIGNRSYTEESMRELEEAYGNAVEIIKDLEDGYTVSTQGMIEQSTRVLEAALDGLQTCVKLDAAGCTVLNGIKEFTIGKNASVGVSLTDVHAERPGYTLLGWTKEKGGEKGFFSLPLGTNEKLYAVWKENTGALKVCPDGGEWNFSSNTTLINGKSGETVIIPEPTRSGYRFDGWKSSTVNGKLTEKEENWEYTFGNSTTADSIRAEWTANSYSVAFHANNGSDDATILESFRYGEEKCLTENSFSGGALTFVGWSFDKNGNVRLADGAKVKNLAADDGAIVDLYAVWAAVDTMLIFDGNGATDGFVMPIAYGETENAPENGFSRVGYSFDGWSFSPDSTAIIKPGETIDFSGCHGVMTLYAVWAPLKYDIEFRDYDGTLLYEQSACFGEKPTFDGETPRRMSESDTEYQFVGWTPELDSVDGNRVYTAVYDEKPRYFDVVFKNEDGSVLQTDKLCFGSYPVFSGDTPQKARTDSTVYTFSGWDSELSPIDGDVVYTAKYSSSYRKYDVRFLNEDGSLLETVSVPFGSTPCCSGAVPVKSEDAKAFYTFCGWNGDTAPVSGDCEYTARFISTPKAKPVQGLTSAADYDKITILWVVSDEDDSVKKYIFRKTENEEAFVVVAEICDNSIGCFSDDTVVAGVVYQYRIVTENSYGLLSIPSDVIECTPLRDTESPSVKSIGLKNGEYIHGEQKITVTATDNRSLHSVKLSASTDGGKNWKLVGESFTSPFAFNIDTRSFRDGEIIFGAVAYDNAGNESDMLTVSCYIDNTPPCKISTVDAVSDSPMRAYVKWSKPSDDVSYYILEATYGGKTVGITVDGALCSYELPAPEPGGVYAFRVCAVDACGNKGEFSDYVTLTVLKDTGVPVIEEQVFETESDGAYIRYRVRANDDFGLKYIRIMASTDGESWIELLVKDFEKINGSLVSGDIDISGFDGGVIYLRAEAEDLFGNISSENGATEFFIELADNLTAVAHVPLKIGARMPSCTENGHEAMTVCAVCGKALTGGELLPATGHHDDNSDGVCDECGERLSDSADNINGDQSNCVCGKYHSGVFAWLVRFIHKLSYFFKNLFEIR